MRTAAARGWTLHPYQEVARDYLRQRDRAALFLDMGLGKTAATLSALEPRHLPALVVAPKRVAENVWPTETKLWRPDLRVAVAAGGPAGRAKAIASNADIVALGRDNLAAELRHVRERGFRTVILDELSSFKNRAAKRWKAANLLINRDPHSTVAHVWGLTGTPSPNGLLDLWGQIALLDNGERLGKNITTYRSRYFFPGRQLPSGVIIEWNLREGAEAKIHAKLEDIALSMETDGRIELPAVTENRVDVELPPAARRIYKSLKDNMLVDLRDLLGGEVHTAKNAAILSSKLSQVSAGFLYPDTDEFGVKPDGYQTIHDEKLTALSGIVEEAQGSPILVFYRFQAERDMLRKRFKQARTIDEPGVIDEWNAGKVPLLLAHPASAGHGLNLQYGGHTVVWTSLDWDLELWEQGNKRVARQGQTHPVVIHLLMGRNTVDHIIRASLDDKAFTQNALLRHLESPL